MHIAEVINVEDKIIEIRNQQVIIDSEVAELYGIDKLLAEIQTNFQVDICLSSHSLNGIR